MIYAGIVTTLMSLCKTFESLLMFVVPFVLQIGDVSENRSARIFLGFTEAGLFPGVSASHYVTF